MRTEEFGAFKVELKQLCATLGKAFTDALAQAYWRVLRDVPLSEIEGNVERILVNATRETRFPKPIELRSNAPQTSRSALMDDQLQGASDRCKRNWDGVFRDDEELGHLELAIATVGRVLAVDHEGSPQYAEALRLDRHYRDDLRELQHRRAGIRSKAE